MKAVVATSRMHESSRRRTDSCEIPGSGTSRQSSMQQDPPPESTDPVPTDLETTPLDQQEPPQENKTKPTEQSALSSSPPRSPKPSNSDVTPTVPAPSRPPLRADGLRQASVLPKTILVQPQLPHKSCSMIEPATSLKATPTLATPPNPNSVSNGFTPEVEPVSKTAPCKWLNDKQTTTADIYPTNTSCSIAQLFY